LVYIYCNMKKIVRLTESDLVKIVKRVIEEEQSFSDKLKQKMLFFKPLKLTDDRKLKLFEFVVDSIDSGDFSTDARRTHQKDVNLVIYSKGEIVIDGIKTTASVVVLNVRKNMDVGRIPSSDVIVQIPKHTKGYGDMGFMDENNPLFQKFVGLCKNIFETDKKLHMELEKTQINLSRVSPHKKKEDEPIPRYGVYYDFDDDDYTNNNGFGGFGGGSFGGGGAGSDF